MLAQNFMTAEALGISEKQQAALIKTLRAFECGTTAPEQFDMRHWCGTACCIGGWMKRLTGVEPEMETGELCDLYVPCGDAIHCTDLAKGAHALRNYLTRGHAYWAGVMASS